MGKVINESLRYQGRGSSFFDIIENRYDIHLGIADKALLLRELRDYEHQGFGDLAHHYARVLNEFGYDSVRFRKAFKRHTKILKWNGRLGKRWVDKKIESELVNKKS